ncbi:MAG: hypothetical protein Q9160_004536 [Pyrenula sp. 1 TL-2023]
MADALTSRLEVEKKRKQHSNENDGHHAKRRSTKSRGNPLKERVSQLEEDLSKYPEDEAKISELVGLLDAQDSQSPQNALVAVTLCRVFIRLMVANPSAITERKGPANLYQKYQRTLTLSLSDETSTVAPTWLELQIRLLKAEAEHLNTNVWESDEISHLFRMVLKAEERFATREIFVTKYLKSYHDCLLHFSRHVANILSSPQSESMLASCIAMLSELDGGQIPSEDLNMLFTSQAHSKKQRVTSLTLRKAVQSAWLAILRSQMLSIRARKTLLRLITPVISPWFTKPEHLMDFLTDSYNLGGSQALLALSGLYQLISTKNLDYPSFYPKLYSQLDNQLLHSTHRSRFFRLLHTFLSSTHLPAALIASFIKRLARLTLFASPAAIVTVVPFTYNLLKINRSTTFMIHRSRSPDAFGDPFDADEPDPLLTNAIDSSLWEFETLQSHYHPNAASIARIVSEQFTKQQYNLEDFLDHSYGSMISAELSRTLKKTPVVEWKIPKTIFMNTNLETNELTDKKDATDPLVDIWNFD